ncbi:MAG: alanine--tRNA ligase [Deltaproteobacteria bacterium]|nr:alanine--tRNA ligase [Deltaproteobacteria bacterium]
MKALSTDEIRSAFLSFFEKHGHDIVTSSSLVPSNDPTLLFTNAGMVQFKDVFTGREARPYVRATTAQKCVRAGGKHNDLENVGYTARHHTFFEMLGNFSFGDYFKDLAIELAWKLITEVYRMPEDRLCVTVFAGEDGIPADEEAAAIWERVGLPKSRIFRLGKKDNYWQMGDTGPQGPCSEIHYYLGDDVRNALDQGKVERSEGWIEIWNLVFMQFQKEKKDSPLAPLPKPSIDTGAGLERLAMVLCGKTSNYDTDAFTPLIGRISDELKKPYGGSMKPDDVSMRVIADHSRAATFLIADGVQPSNEGRGYVLRRIMRRAIRHGSRLGYDDLFFHRACLAVIDRMQRAYPELERTRSLVGKVAESEETAFRKTLERGLKYLAKEMEEVRARSETSIDPVFVAKLYHTYGFPIDLTRVIASENELSVDEVAAEKAVVDSYKDKGSGRLGAEAAIESIYFEVRQDVGPTIYLGYDQDAASATVKALIVGGQMVSEAATGADVEIVLDRTPFYGESGGQVGDRGSLRAAGLELEVSDATKPRSDLTIHVGKVRSGMIQRGQTVEAIIDRKAREATRKNHSATHLLHLALKEVLGDHVLQKGSLVAPDRLRFDFAHFSPVSREQIEAIERRVNELVLADASTETKVSSVDEARQAGAVMLFGEKYGDQVRMVRIGVDSLELCGGTHVRRAGEIGFVKIVSDSALASGVRRIEAVTGMGAVAWAQRQNELLTRAAGLLRTSPEELSDRLEKLQKKQKELEQKLEEALQRAAMGGGSTDPVANAVDVDGVRVVLHVVTGVSPKALREISDQLRDKLASGVVVLGADVEGKGSILVAVTKDLAGRIHAGKVVQEVSQAMEGKGGGRPDFAQGGGRADRLSAGMACAKEAIAKAVRG